MAHEATSREQICCPHCLAEYNFSDAKPDYIHSIKGFDEIFYVALCYNCRGLVQTHWKMEKNKHCAVLVGTYFPTPINGFQSQLKWQWL